jgi:hypothetical protein
VWIAVLSAPPLFAAATFSQPLLGLWVGKELTNFWVWQSLAFTMPLITVLLSFGFSSLFSRIHVNKAANHFIIVRIILQYAIAFTLMTFLGERAFILGTAVAIAATAFWEFRIIFREHTIDPCVVRELVLLTIIGLLLTAILLPFAGMVHSLLMLFIALGAYTLFFWCLLWAFVIPVHTKKALLSHRF